MLKFDFQSAITCQNIRSMVDGMLDLWPVINFMLVLLECASNVSSWSTPKIIIGLGTLLLENV
jgi:hypothetical protein